MATDSTNLPLGEANLDAGTDLAGSELDLAGVQLAQVEGAQPVQLPEGHKVILIPVRPGQVIQLPTDSITGLSAKIGPEGNLAFVIDGRTIILQGYVKANDQSPVKIVTNDGDTVVPAEIIAGTDKTLEIQTAAGPATGGQGDTDTSGNGIFIPFATGPGLGLIDAEGVLGATALRYRLIDDDPRIFELEEEDSSPDFSITFDILGGIVNEDDLGPDAIKFPQEQFQALKLVLSDAGKSGEGNDPFDATDNENQDGTPDDTDGVDSNANGVDDDREPLETIATVKVDFHGDVPGKLEVDLSLLPSGLTSEGEDVVYEEIPAGGGKGNAIVAFVDGPGGTDGVFDEIFDRLVFTVQVDKDLSDSEFKVTFTLYDNLDNAAPDSLIGKDEQILDLPVKFTITDSTGSTVDGTLPLGVEDDVPFFGEVQGTPGIDLTIVEKDPGVTNDESLLPLEGDDQSYLDPANKAFVDDVSVKLNDNGFDVPSLLESIGTLLLPNLAQRQVHVSFGADGPTEFNKGAADPNVRNSVFGQLSDDTDADGDGIDNGENEHPYELFMVQNGHAATLTDGDLTIQDQATKNTVTWNGVIETVFLHQIDAHTIVGYIDTTPEGDAKASFISDDFDIDSNKEAVFVITIDDDGVLSFVQFHQLNHPDAGPKGPDHDEPLQILGEDGTPLVYVRATDFDGDHVIAPVNITVEDDGPCFIHTLYTHPHDIDLDFTISNGEVVGVVDEDALKGGNPFGPGDDVNILAGKSTDGIVIFSIGEDRPGDIDIHELKVTDHNGVEIPLASLKTADDQAIIIDKSGDTWIGHTGNPADPVFVFALDTALEPIGTVGFTFTLHKPLEHSLEDDPSTGKTEIAFEDDLHFDFTVRATDVDGDWADGHVKVLIDDDSPVVLKNILESFRLSTDETIRETKDGKGKFDDIDSKGINGTAQDGLTIENDEIVNKGAVTAAGLKDTGLVGAGTESTADLFIASPGADGGTIAYTLNFTPGATALFDTLSTETINLVAGIGGVIEGRTALTNELVFAIKIDSGTGLVTMAQYRAINHGGEESAPGFHDEVKSLGEEKLTVTVTVIDKDGDKATETRDIGNGIRFEDDGPTTVLALKGGVEIRVDESVGPSTPADTNFNDEDENEQGDSSVIGFASIAGGLLFSDVTDFGTDGPAADPADKVFAFTLVAGASGLKDTQSGLAVVLSIVGTDIVGKAGADVVFTMSIDPTDGDVTLKQFRAVVHGDKTDHDENDTPEFIDAGRAFVTLTVKDGDADTASSKVDIGGVVKFEDDGPTVDLALKDKAELRLDESLAPSQPDDPNGNDGDETASVGDKIDIGFATIKGSALFTSSIDFGSDKGAKVDSTVFELSIAKDGAPSGLVDTETGLSVLLFDLGAQIVGKTSGGDKVFTIDVNAGTGDVEVHQYRAIVNDDKTDPDESDGSILPETIGAGLVGLKVTVTDGDGDKASDSIDLGPVIVFEDDGPGAELIKIEIEDEGIEQGDGNLVHDETKGVQDGGNSSGAFDPDPSGQDEDDVSPPRPEFTVFEGLNGLTSIGYAATIVNVALDDGKGNPNAAFGSDGPGDVELSLTKAGGAIFSGDQTNLRDTESTEFIFLFTVGDLVVGRSGANAAAALTGPISFALSLDDLGNLSLAQYRAIQHPTSPDEYDESVTLLAANGVDALVNITVKVTDEDGDSVTKELALDGKNGDNGIIFQDDGPSIQAVDESLSLSVDETVAAKGTGDVLPDPGDTDEDDEQNVTLPASLTILGDVIGADTGNGAALFSFDPGTDGLQSKLYELEVTGDGDTGLTDTQTDRPVILSLNAITGVIEGRAVDGDPATDDPLAFAFDIDPDTGAVSMAQYRAVDHDDKEAAPGQHDEVVSMEAGVLAVKLTVTDGDDDVATLSRDISGNISIDDDGPHGDLLSIKVGTGSDSFLVHDETAGVQDKGSLDVTDFDPDASTQDEDDVLARPSAFDDFELIDHIGIQPVGYASTTVAILDGGSPVADAVYGSDGPGTTKIELTDSAGKAFDGDQSNLLDTLNGRPIFLYTEDGLVVGRVGDALSKADPTGQIAFAIAIDGDSLDVAQYVAIKHPETDEHDESVTLLNGPSTNLSALVFATVTITDKDGDSVTKSVPFDGVEGHPAIVFQDDGPVANADKDSVTEGGPTVATGNVITESDADPIGGVADANDTDGVADSAGADGFGGIAWKDTGEVDDLDTDGVIQGAHGKLYVDGEGNYKYELDETKDAVKDLDKNEQLTETFTYTIKDGDDDTATTTLTITINGKSSPPETDIRIGAEGNTEPICVPEDSGGVVIPVVAITTSGSHLTTIVISGFPTTALTDGWTIDLSDLDDGNTTVVSTIGTDGKVTITFDDAVSTNFTSSITVSPPADSDVDLGTLTAAVEAVSNTDNTLKDDDSDQAFVRVDAIADGDDKGDDKDGDTLGVTILVTETVTDGDTSFQSGDAGNVKVTASYDDFKDGSEIHTLIVDAPAGFSFNLLSLGTIPPGVTLDGASTATHLIFNVDSEDDGVQNGIADFELNIPVTYNGGEPDGESGDFSATVTTTEDPTDEECDLTNNTDSASKTDDVVIAKIPTTNVILGVEGDTDFVCVQEDSAGVDVPVSASTTAGSHLTTIVISGFPVGGAGFTIQATGLDLANTTVSNTIGVDGKINITFDDAVTTGFSGSFKVIPPADSDLDLGTLIASVEAANNTDPNVKGDDEDETYVRVDAVADGKGVGFGDDGDGSKLSVDITAVDSADGDTTFGASEKGTLTLNATFDDFKDGSEKHQITIEAPAGFVFTGTFLSALPTGVVKNVGLSDADTLVLDIDSNDAGDAGVGSITDLKIEIQNASAGSGVTADFAATATAEELNTTATNNDSNKECTDDNNKQSASDTASVTTLNNFIPNAEPDVNTATNVTTDYQLMLVLDISGSMDQIVPNSGGKTRLELARDALIALIEKFQGSTNGSVQIKIVTFSSGADYFGGSSASLFIDAAIAIQQLQAISPTFGNSFTDYDSALDLAQDGIVDGSWSTPPGGTVGRVYWVSDGRPTSSDDASPYPGGDASNQINDAEQASWETALNTENVTSIAIGIGSDVANGAEAAQAADQLGRVAHVPNVASSGQVTIIDDINGLAAALVSTLPAPVNGNLLSNDVVNPADPLTVPNKIFDIDDIKDAGQAAAAPTIDDGLGHWVITTEFGKLVVDQDDGGYAYTPFAGSEGKIDSFLYTIKDTIGGDIDTATLTITIESTAQTINGTVNADTLKGGLGNDTLNGGNGNDILWGGEGDDTVNGDANNDYIVGGAGNDNLNGGANNDTYVFLPGDGKDTITDTGGTDKITLLGGPLFINAFNAGNTAGGAGSELVIQYGLTGLTDQIVVADHYTAGDANKVETLEIIDGPFSGTYTISTDVTSPLDDGNDSNDLIAGGGGGEILEGEGGDDLLFGGGGVDTLNGEAGDDLLSGGKDGSIDTLNGEDNNDSFFIDEAIDVVSGGTGTDTVYSLVTYTISNADVENLVLTGAGNINGTGNASANNLTGNSGTNTLTGLGGNDTYHFFAGSGTDTVVDSAGSDTIKIDGGINALSLLRSGNDLVIEYGVASLTDKITVTDHFKAGDNDIETLTITGGKFEGSYDLDQDLTGGEGGSGLAGTTGDDGTLDGEDGDDLLFGQAGKDTLDGGADDDYLDGGNDAVLDVLNGGGGGDTLIWRGTADTYDGGADADILDVSGGGNINFTGFTDSKIENIETVRMTGGGGSSITLGLADVVNFEGGTFNPDTLNYGSQEVLQVDGDNTDTVNLTGGSWLELVADAATPAGYRLFAFDPGGTGAAEDAYVLVQQGVSVNLS